jgi:hypothetical protein
MQVFVSGNRLREEHSLKDGKAVVLRFPEHDSVAFNTSTRTGVRLQTPPPRPKNMRDVVERAQDGTVLRRLQFLTDGIWLDLLVTRCSPAGIMLHQFFTAFDNSGNPLNGELIQIDIRIGPVPEEAFQLPKDIVLR